MAVLDKSRARKPLAIGPILTGYGNYASTGLPETKHIKIGIRGENHIYDIRMTFGEAKELIDKLWYYIARHEP